MLVHKKELNSSQKRKRDEAPKVKNFKAPKLSTWKDFCSENDIQTSPSEEPVEFNKKLDDVRKFLELGSRRCHCGDFTTTQIARSPKNFGRPFYCCKNNPPCKYFRWVEDCIKPKAHREEIDLCDDEIPVKLEDEMQSEEDFALDAPGWAHLANKDEFQSLGESPVEGMCSGKFGPITNLLIYI